MRQNALPVERGLERKVEAGERFDCGQLGEVEHGPEVLLTTPIYSQCEAGASQFKSTIARLLAQRLDSIKFNRQVCIQ
jgi:hypothetical protein